MENTSPYDVAESMRHPLTGDRGYWVAESNYPPRVEAADTRLLAAASVGEVVAAWLKYGGYDGLAGDECGCRLGEMFLCDRADANCKPARYVECGACERKDTETCIYPCDDATGCFIAAAIEQRKEGRS